MCNSLATSSWGSESAWANELILIPKNICKILFYLNPIYGNGFWMEYYKSNIKHATGYELAYFSLKELGWTD